MTVGAGVRFAPVPKKPRTVVAGGPPRGACGGARGGRRRRPRARAPPRLQEVGRARTRHPLLGRQCGGRVTPFPCPPTTRRRGSCPTSPLPSYSPPQHPSPSSSSLYWGWTLLCPCRRRGSAPPAAPPSTRAAAIRLARVSPPPPHPSWRPLLAIPPSSPIPPHPPPSVLCRWADGGVQPLERARPAVRAWVVLHTGGGGAGGGCVRRDAAGRGGGGPTPTERWEGGIAWREGGQGVV